MKSKEKAHDPGWYKQVVKRRKRLKIHLFVGSSLEKYFSKKLVIIHNFKKRSYSKYRNAECVENKMTQLSISHVGDKSTQDKNIFFQSFFVWDYVIG